MRRVVITGMGIWSSIGQDLKTVTESLRLGRSGIVFDPARIEYGYQSGLVGNIPRPDLKPYLTRAQRMLISSDGEYAYMATRQAFDQAGITAEYLKANKVGIIFGNDGNSHQIEYNRIMEEVHNSLLIGYNAGLRSITSSIVLNLSSIFHFQGVNLTISSACASASQSVGLATMFIRHGMEDMILVGGAAELNKEDISVVSADALLLDYQFNSEPTQASRPFDTNAVGCIITGGASALVLEEYEHAINRGATILAEIVGYGYSGGGMDESHNVDWRNDYQAMSMALDDAGVQSMDIDFVHARADSAPGSDIAEATALNELFATYRTPVSSTDSIAGHESWAAGTNRMVYSILMMQNDFIAPTLNMVTPIKEAGNLNIIRQTTDKHLNTILMNSAGLGGVNCAIILKKI